MKKIRIFAAFLLVALLFASVSCKKKSTTGIQLTASELSEYTVIIPESLPNAAREKITAMILSIQTNFGTLLRVKDDRYTEPTEKEILVGFTNRPQTDTVKKLLRYGETYVGFQDGKLVILGSTDEDTLRAIDYFAGLVAQRKGADLLFDSVKDLRHEKKVFELPDLSLNGISLSEYTILYPNSNAKREKRFAELIRQVVMEKCGIIVPVQSDKQAAYGDILLVGGSGSQAGLRASEDVVEVVGNSENDLFFAVQTLVGRIEASTGEVTVGASEQLSYTTGDLDLLAYGMTTDRITIMSYNVQNAGGGAFDSTTKFPNLAAVIDTKNPDFVCMQECVNGSNAADQIRKKMKNADSYETIRSDKNAETSTAMTAILFNTAKYKLLASDTVVLRKITEAEANAEPQSLWDRYFTYAKVQSKASGAVFVVIAAHVDYVEEIAYEEFVKLLAYVEEHFEGLPVLIAGDYNLMKPHETFTYLENLGYADTRETADNTKNGHVQTFPKEDRLGPRTIDFIYERSLSTYYFEVITSQEEPSDHRPIYAECYIDMSR